MAREFAKDFYNSENWKKTRRAFFVQQRGMCARCQEEFEDGRRKMEDINPGKIVHHKIHLSPENLRDPKIALSFDNLEVLCDEHHNEHHHGKKKRYKFDKDGRVIPTEDTPRG